MKILYLSARFPFPPDRGDRLTGYHLLRTFSRRHRVTLLSFVDGHEPDGSAQALQPFCERIETVPLSRATSWRNAWLGLASTRPSQVSFYRSRAMQERAAALVADGGYDAVFVQLFRMAPFVQHLRHPLKVLFFADSLALSLARSRAFQPLWKRPGVEWERWRVSRFEPAVSRDFRECWVLSDVDRRDLEVRGCQRVRAVPHGVDDRLFEQPLGPRPERRAVFLGNLSVPHNVDAAVYLAREIWPQVRARCPDAVLELVGADAVPAVRALHDPPSVVVTGAVPDLLPVWARARVLVAPLRFSAGIQNKVLEAMAAGVPVVTTPPAAEAIGARDGVDIRVGADTEGLARATLDALTAPDDPAWRQRARGLVRSGFSWEALARRLEDLASTPTA